MMYQPGLDVTKARKGAWEQRSPFHYYLCGDKAEREHEFEGRYYQIVSCKHSSRPFRGLGIRLDLCFSALAPSYLSSGIGNWLPTVKDRIHSFLQVVAQMFV